MDEMDDKIRVLYAEDDRRDADLTQTYFSLEAPEFEMDIVDTGQACLQRLAQNEYDVLLLDYRLPDMDGADVLRILTRQGFTQPVVMVTGAGDEDLVVRALRLGASEYVQKKSDYLVSLPRILSSVVGEYRRKQKSGRPFIPKQRRILYVEHNQMDIDLTHQHFVEVAPHQTLQVARSCAQALQLLLEVKDNPAAASYDLVLADLCMSDMSALDFYWQIKYQGMSFPFIILTGMGDENTAVAALRLGAYDYIVKREGYLIQLPYVIDNAIARFQLDQMSSRWQDELEQLNRSLEQKVIERTVELQQEIAERKRVEEQIKAALAEKEILLREVHHRVGNNLAVMSALLDMQANASPDEQTRAALKVGEARVHAMALVYKQLIGSPDLTAIDMSKYLPDLAAGLFSADLFNKIMIEMEVQPIKLEIDRAIPCGLIVNELAFNAIQHAFPAERLHATSLPPGENAPQIIISMSQSGESYLMGVCDNGCGLPEGMDVQQVKSLGLKLVNRLVGQLHGEMQVESLPSTGASFHITFPVK